MKLSANRPVTFVNDGIKFEHSVGSSIKDLLQKSNGKHGVMLLLVSSVVLVPGMELHDVDVAFVPGNEIFDDCPLDEEDQAHVRMCLDACKDHEYVLVVVIHEMDMQAKQGKEETHICVADRNLEERTINPRNN